MNQSASFDPADDHDDAGMPDDVNDCLTTLPTRDAFCRHIDAMRKSSPASGHSVAVLYLDLDHFKGVNSLHGRAVGDQVLQRVAERFAQAARGAAMVSRVGGDEFACLLWNHADYEPLEKLAIALLAAVSRPARIGAFDLVVTPSIGIVFCPATAANAMTMLRWAASAMYRARHEKLGYAFDTYQRHSVARPLFQFGHGRPREK